MKNLILGMLAILFTVDYAHACSCSSYPLYPEAAIKSAVTNAIDGGRSTKIISIEPIKAYPSLLEKLNIEGFKGTSCEVIGPNNESLFYCSSRIKTDSKVIATKWVSPTQEVMCTVIVRSVAKYTSVSAKVIAQTCK